MIFSHRWHCATVFGKERDIIKFRYNVPCSRRHTHTNPAPLRRGPYYRSGGPRRPSEHSRSFSLAGPRWRSKGVQERRRRLWTVETNYLSGNYERTARVWPWRGDLVARVEGVTCFLSMVKAVGKWDSVVGNVHLDARRKHLLGRDSASAQETWPSVQVLEHLKGISTIWQKHPHGLWRSKINLTVSY